jgi:hypothetical protein
MTAGSATVAIPEALDTERATPLEHRSGPWSRRVRGGWIVEAGVIGAALVVHDIYRNALMGGRVESLRRARAFETLERSLGIAWEHSVQQFFIGSPVLIGMFNVYYQWMHFLVPLAAAIFLYVKFPARYVRWRNVFFVMLFITGPFGWWAFPVTPPKYLPAKDGFVDTQVKYFSIGTMRPIAYGRNGEPRADIVLELGNTYSGMPSHHVTWALWSVVALWPVVRRRWLRGILVMHMLLTALAITVTANHHLIDIPGSVVELLVAFCLVLGFEHAVALLRARRASASAGDG